MINSLILSPLVEFMKKYPNIEISIESGITDKLIQKLSNGEVDIVVLNLPYSAREYSNVEIMSLKKSKFAFFASKKYLEIKKIDNLIEISKNKFILSKRLSAKRKILYEIAEENEVELVANYEVYSTSIMKKLVLNDIRIGFSNIENLKDIQDDTEILKVIDLKDTAEGIASLKKNMYSKIIIELLKLIKKYNEK